MNDTLITAAVISGEVSKDRCFRNNLEIQLKRKEKLPCLATANPQATKQITSTQASSSATAISVL
jgi:hypothetical protein